MSEHVGEVVEVGGVTTLDDSHHHLAQQVILAACMERVVKVAGPIFWSAKYYSSPDV